MTQQTPQHIICAVRGKPYSRETATGAIDLALETGARLTFFYVADVEFLDHATVGPLSVVYHEMVEMGKFTMMVLCDRAERRGVKEVDYIVRQGNFLEQLHLLVAEAEADMLVIGRPTRGPGLKMFGPAEFDAFVAKLERDFNLRVVQVTPSDGDR
jgi:nucleotide-binding universal stress UspA family protein